MTPAALDLRELVARRFGSAAPCTKSTRHGLDRVRPPEETLALVRRVMPKMGITRVANLTGLDRVGVPVVAVTRPNSRSLAVSLGKGFTLAAAKASGVMEAIECFHSEHVEQPLLLSSYERLRERGNVIDMPRLPRVSGGAFRPGQKLLWVKGRELFGDQECWLPYELVHTDYTLPFPTGSGAFLMSSNGVASGNHLLEAMSHGICELVERDATTLWRYSSPQAQAAARVDLSSVDDGPCRAVLEQFAAARVVATVWDASSDVGIASFICRAQDAANSDHPALHPVSGYGCHPRREIALMRALTEAAQGRLTVISGARDDLSQSLFEAGGREQAAADSGLERVGAERAFSAAPSWNSSALEDDVAWELQRLACAGMEQVVVVDLTRPEFEIPVVRVVIPGLEAICEAPGYVPGARLQRLLEPAT